MNFTKKMVWGFILSVGLISNHMQAKPGDQIHQVTQNQQRARDEKGRTPFMNLIIELDAKIKACKYGNDNLANARAMVQESYFLTGTYSFVGPLVSDAIEAKVEHLAEQIKNEIDCASAKITTMGISAEDFFIRDFDGKTVMQHCTTKESYEFLRLSGAEFKINRAIRIYGRHYAPAFLDYIIAPYLLFGLIYLEKELNILGYISNQKINDKA